MEKIRRSIVYTQQKFVKEDFKSNSFVDVKFYCCVFQDCNFSKSLFENSSFKNCVFENTDMTGCIFSYCIFNHTQINNSHFDSSTIKNCTFNETELFNNTSSELRIFHVGGTIREWSQYQSKINALFHGMKNNVIYKFKSKEEKKKEQELVRQQIKIIDYATSLGFHITKVGRYYSLKEHDSVRIDAEKNCFWRNSNGASGSVIDFAIEFTNMPIEDIIGNFVEMLEAEQILPTSDKVNKEVIKKPKELILPAWAKNMKNVYAYLISARGIDSEIVSKFVKDKMLYQDVNSNCVFVCRKGDTPVYAYKNGTNTYKPFKGDVEGCNYDYCFFINNYSKEIIVTEAIIDAMSIMTILKQKGKDYCRYNYLALCGVDKQSSLFHHIKADGIQYEKIFLALDNDNSGLNAMSQIELKLRDYKIKAEEWTPAHTKDWNDELRYLKENGLECDTIQ